MPWPCLLSGQIIWLSVLWGAPHHLPEQGYAGYSCYFILCYYILFFFLYLYRGPNISRAMVMGPPVSFGDI